MLCSSSIGSCSVSPRYSRSTDSLDYYTPQRLERRVRCPKCDDTTWQTTNTSPKNRKFVKQGKASFYGSKFHGRKTASGEQYDQYQLTAAHRTLPFGTIVKVTNTANNQTVTVRINDRGPQKRGRIIDLSFAAAKKIGMLQQGIGVVSIDIVSSP